ncbi:ribonuclease HII [Pseudogracilibacillus auburnensis]|uniref:Ribonuclease HII n=1 Tax=Pseudogracilibacillus auburnensis TaxID=1494959 RepID=A0A2V3W3Q6_9BACI|nr:ribonuclease HII [Pseudogracilibacillus auburnensis]MBO1003823.1 ribonuclease HII [Pseudogracilibacillus auburnensis]PXW88590.1 RNase HII [Pseudogracilibacillus auburnensis]
MKTKPIHTIKELLDQDEIDVELINELREDKRKGVQRLITIYDKKQQKKATLLHNFHQMDQFDQQFCTYGKAGLAGVDEAGRGPLAGPVVAAAVMLPAGFTLIGLTDSKQLTETERNIFYERITEQAISYHVSILHNKIIDEINIFQATKRAMIEALVNLEQTPTMALIDAVKLSGLPFPTKEIIKGDEKSVAIAAASVLAKVTRDRLMEEMDEKYPMYDFKNNKGYGTKKHLHALKKYGATPYHRRSFGPVMQAITS